MEESDLSDVLMDMIKRTIGRVMGSHTQLEKEEQNLDGIVDFAASTLVHEDTTSKKDSESKSAEEIRNYSVVCAQEAFEEKFQQLNGQEQLLESEKVAILHVVDTKWTDHIDAMNQLHQSVGLRTYDQNSPLVKYQAEGYPMYNNMMGSIEYEVTRLFVKPEVRQNVRCEQVAQGQAEHPETEQDTAAQGSTSAKRQPVRVDKKMSRNDLCPCGSSKKLKGCHGGNA